MAVTPRRPDESLEDYLKRNSDANEDEDTGDDVDTTGRDFDELDISGDVEAEVFDSYESFADLVEAVPETPSRFAAGHENVERWRRAMERINNPRATFEELRNDLAFYMRTGGDPLAYEAGLAQGAVSTSLNQLLTAEELDSQSGAPRTVLGFEDVDFRVGDIDDQFGRREQAGIPGMGGRVDDSQEKMLDRLTLGLEDLNLTEMQTLIMSYDGNDLLALQATFLDAGFYGEARPVFGHQTQADFDAMRVMIESSASAGPSVRLDELLDSAISANTSSSLSPLGEAIDRTVREIQSPESIGKDIDNMYEAVMGRGAGTLDRTIRSELIGKRRAELIAEAQEEYDLTQSEFGLDVGSQQDVDRLLEAMGPADFSASQWAAASQRVFNTQMARTDANETTVRRALARHYLTMNNNDVHDAVMTWAASPFSPFVTTSDGVPHHLGTAEDPGSVRLSSLGDPHHLDREERFPDHLRDPGAGASDTFNHQPFTTIPSDITRTVGDRGPTPHLTTDQWVGDVMRRYHEDRISTEEQLAGEGGLVIRDADFFDLEAAIRETDPTRANVYEFAGRGHSFFGMLGRTVPRGG